MIDKAVKSGADVLITGDIDHHEGIDAVAKGIAIIDGGHYGLEKIFVPYITNFLQRELPGIEILSAMNQEPFWYI